MAVAILAFVGAARGESGPWFGFAPLPGTNALPADAGTEGIPDWPWLDHWRVGGSNATLEAGTGFR